MRDQSPQFYCGIDVGTSAVRCIVGVQDQTDSDRISVVGHSYVPTSGMRKGNVAHVEEVSQSIARAVSEVERVSGANIASATVNINGSHIQGMDSRGVVAISTANREISPEDRMRVEQAAATIQMPPNRQIIEVFSKSYRVDGQDNIKDPIGMEGVRLEVDTHIVTATMPNLRSLTQALDAARIQPSRITLSSLAAAEVVLNRQQKESGTLLLDIGAGTTNFFVMEDGEIQHVAVLPVGGMHITNDLAIGLRTDLDVAERVKLAYRSKSDERRAKSAVSGNSLSVTQDGYKHTFDYDTIDMIIEARTEELFEIVDKELRKIHKSQKLPGGVVIVGGTAQLSGIAELAKEKLRLAARVGRMQNISGLIDTINDPSYAASIGLMTLDMLLAPDNVGDSSEPHNNFFGLVDGALGLIRRKPKPGRGRHL
jgi:cell division protein FtsA